MFLKTLLALGAIGVTLGRQVGAQTYDTNGVAVQTFAGSGFYGYLDGVGQQTMFYNPDTIVADSQGNLFVWDAANGRIRKIAPDATVTTFAGGGNQSTGIGTNVNLAVVVAGMTIDRNDTIWIVSGSYLYKTTTSAIVTRTNALSSLLAGQGICLDSSGNAYISDGAYISGGGNKIYRYSTNAVLNVFAGSGNRGYADGVGSTVGRTYQVQSSPDTSKWIIRATLFLSSSPYLWIDQNPGSGNRFYRALLLP